MSQIEGGTRKNTKLLLFSGKGGVGKTTLAAATAVQLSRRGKRVLLASIDPAHSLADVLDVHLDSGATEVAPGFDATQVNAELMFAESVGLERYSPGSATAQVLRLASQLPGIDEWGAVKFINFALRTEKYDFVVLDTAPTGHALRLLSMPSIMHAWFLRILGLEGRLIQARRFVSRLVSLGTRGEGRIGIPGIESVAKSRDRAARVMKVLRNRQTSALFLVTIPEPLSILETDRMLADLRQMDIPVRGIIVNQVQRPASNCLDCRRRRTAHTNAIRRIRALGHSLPIHEILREPEALGGIDDLASLQGLGWLEDSELLDAAIGVHLNPVEDGSQASPEPHKSRAHAHSKKPESP